jgi:RES domain-containing protein
LIHNPELLDKLAAFKTEPFEGQVYRATRMSLDPTAYSAWGGRWAPKDDYPALYTSLDPNGAIAEIAHHWSLMNPRPSKPVVVHTLRVSATQTLKLIRADLKSLGVDLDRFGELDYTHTQESDRLSHFQITMDSSCHRRGGIATTLSYLRMAP